MGLFVDGSIGSSSRKKKKKTTPFAMKAAFLVRFSSVCSDNISYSCRLRLNLFYKIYQSITLHFCQKLNTYFKWSERIPNIAKMFVAFSFVHRFYIFSKRCF